MKKKNVKDLNIWQYMQKLTQDEVDNMPETEKLNLLTDGWGNYYLPPDNGKTDLYVLDGDEIFLYCYNFGTKELEAYVERPADGYSRYELVDSTGLNIGNFADNPEYWINVEAKKLQQYGYAEAETLIENPSDKELYKYEILAMVEFSGHWDEVTNLQRKFRDFVSGLSKETELYTQKLTIDCEYNQFSSELHIVCTFGMPMTKDDLLDVWDDYETIILNNQDFNNVINMYLIDMKVL